MDKENPVHLGGYRKLELLLVLTSTSPHKLHSKFNRRFGGVLLASDNVGVLQPFARLIDSDGRPTG